VSDVPCELPEILSMAYGQAAGLPDADGCSRGELVAAARQLPVEELRARRDAAAAVEARCVVSRMTRVFLDEALA
jgi:hypothetical protein